ncbi:hypothetical protein BJF92_12195 [Rhizobium rhizosphaerae]|uniref:Uncharacterized protein n=1 Tax=Xaviernesmea rhizosphaerae TaxID=1672749 RepID=A0A1Q9ANC0_9HYPH|nr:hypothetical protein [Xaviernesmea rhizosphaerae]OLP56825.1 hypothetical protein BJF92_12195 [Xaviernesmea rhizosphaerae]
MDLKLSSADIAQLQRSFQRMPGEIQTKVLARVMRRLGSMARTRIVARSSKHTQMPAAIVRALTTAAFNAGGNTSTVVVNSNWIPLQALGAVQNAKGSYVNRRGQYDHAFVAQFASGHVGVMQRIPGTQMPSRQTKREQIRELFGANPAHAITNDPETYLDVMAEVIQEYMLPRMVHELERVLFK